MSLSSSPALILLGLLSLVLSSELGEITSGQWLDNEHGYDPTEQSPTSSFRGSSPHSRRMNEVRTRTKSAHLITTDISRGGTICRAGNHSHPNVTLLFLHIFKAAGSTTRDTLSEYAGKCGLNFRTCGSKCSRSHGSYICLKPRGQAETREQVSAVQKGDVIAGHLWFGLHRSLAKPALYITCLRRPLETAISGVLYLHSREVAKLDDVAAASLVRTRLQSSGRPPTNFVKRLTGSEPRDSRDSKLMAAATRDAISNLQRYFVVVGVVEEYGAFVNLMQHLLDPKLALTPRFWRLQKSKRENSSVKPTSLILNTLQRLDKEEAVHRNKKRGLLGNTPHNRSGFLNSFNSSLHYDWLIYEAGYDLFKEQSRRRGVQPQQQ